MFDFPEKAFDPMKESLEWRERKAPYRTAHVRGIVQHWRKQIEVYQTIGNGVVKKYSDTWTAILRREDWTTNNMQVGDTLDRLDESDERFTIQSVSHEGEDSIIAMTANKNAGG